jgi:hypothetical protein
MDILFIFSIRTAVFIVLLRYGGYFGEKETPLSVTVILFQHPNSGVHCAASLWWIFW